MTDTCSDCGKDLGWHRRAGDNVNSGRCPSCFRTFEQREIVGEYRRLEALDDARHAAVAMPGWYPDADDSSAEAGMDRAIYDVFHRRAS